MHPLPEYFQLAPTDGMKNEAFVCCQRSYCFPENVCVCHETFTKLILISGVPPRVVCATLGQRQSRPSLQGRGVTAANALKGFG